MVPADTSHGVCTHWPVQQLKHDWTWFPVEHVPQKYCLVGICVMNTASIFNKITTSYQLIRYERVDSVNDLMVEFTPGWLNGGSQLWWLGNHLLSRCPAASLDEWQKCVGSFQCMAYIIRQMCHAGNSSVQLGVETNWKFNNITISSVTARCRAVTRIIGPSHSA